MNIVSGYESTTYLKKQLSLVLILILISVKPVKSEIIPDVLYQDNNYSSTMYVDDNKEEIPLMLIVSTSGKSEFIPDKLDSYNGYGTILDEPYNTKIEFPSGDLARKGLTLISSGKWYWEVYIDEMPEGAFPMIGLIAESYINLDGYIGGGVSSSVKGWSISKRGYAYFPGGFYIPSLENFGPPPSDSNAILEYKGFSEGDVVGFALNMDDQTLQIHVNGIWQGIIFGPGMYPINEPVYIGLSAHYIDPCILTLNTGQQPFKYDVPSGYTPGLGLGTPPLPVDELIDSDGDGVIDGWDICPETQVGSVVNNQGCATNSQCEEYLSEYTNYCQTEIASLSEQLDTITRNIENLELNFQSTFNDPNFVIPGDTPAERIKNLINAIINLNKGRKNGIYDYF